MDKIRVIVWGIGAMGSAMVRMMVGKESLEIVGAICRAYPDSKDAAKVRAGKDLGEVAGVGRKLGIIVSDNPDDVFAKAKADIVLHATSFLSEEHLHGQILKALEAKLNVISITDGRLMYPWIHWPELGRQIDEAAKRNGVTFLETGTDPGIIPILFTGMCTSICRVTIKVVVDMGCFGISVLKQRRFGISPDEFRKTSGDKLAVELSRPYSSRIDMIADALGWELDETRLTVEPIIARNLKKMASGMVIEPGLVCGYKRLYQGMKDGVPVITVDWLLVVNPQEEKMKQKSRITIEGEPNMDVVIRGLPSDIATYAPTVNAIPYVVKAKPGLVTLRDLPVAAALPGKDLLAQKPSGFDLNGGR